VKIVHRGDASNGTIVWRDSTGRWMGDQVVPLASPDCRRLARTVALALTVQIRLLASGGSPSATPTPPVEEAPPEPPVPPPPPPPPPPPVPVAAVSRVETPTPARGARPLFDIRAGSSIGLGMSAGPVVLGRVAGSVGWPRLSLELAFEGSLPATSRREDGAGFAQQQLLVSTAACGLRGSWSVCAVAKGGEVRMAGKIDRPTSAVVPLFEAGARLGFVLWMGKHVFLAPHLDALVNVTRWTGALDQVPVWTAPRFAAVAGLDLGVVLSGGRAPTSH